MKIQNAKHTFFFKQFQYINDYLDEFVFKKFTPYVSPLTIRKIKIFLYIYSTEITLTVESITMNLYEQYLLVYRSGVWHLFANVQHIHGPRVTKYNVTLMAIVVCVVCVSGKCKW